MEINIKSKKPDLIRSAKQLRDVLYDQDWVKKIKDFPVYYVWRGIKKEGELRYDITIIPPKMLGKEFPKTKGHEHKGNFSEIITHFLAVRFSQIPPRISYRKSFAKKGTRF